MTTVSEVSICNLALGWLGANLITSLEDTTVEGKLCNANFDSSRDAVIEVRDWNFASSRVILHPLAEEPEFGYSHQFTLPGDLIRIMQVGNNPEFTDDLDWTREENRILADVDLLYMRYLKRITDVNRFTPGFVHAFAARLASDLAVPLTNSKEMQQLMMSIYLGKLETAGTMDGIQGKNIKLRALRLVKVR